MPDGSELDADVCIIGGGAAGITIARELAASRVRCTVLEAGELTYDQREQALYQGQNVGLPYFPLDVARVRFLGGSTNHYGGLCRPFDKEDFERRPWVPHSGWPITRAEVEPYYARAWRVLGLRSGVFGLDEWLQSDPFRPLDLPPSRLVTRIAQIVSRSRRSLGQAYVEELRRSKDVTLFLNANVLEIDADRDARTATRVRVATLTGRRFAVRPRIVVLAVGGLENPRILLSSNGRSPRGLGNDHGLVGRYFIEHPRFHAALLYPSNANLDVRLYDDHVVRGTHLEAYLAVPRAVQREESLVDVQLKLRAMPTKAFADAEDSEAVDSLKAVARAAKHGRVPPGLEENLASVVDDLMTWQTFSVPGTLATVPYPELVGRVMRASSPDRQSLVPEVLGDIAGLAYKGLVGSVPLDAVVVTARIDAAPNPDSRVTLGNERDALGMRRLVLDWRLSRIDRESVGRTLDLFASAIGARGLGRVRRLFDPNGNAWPADLAGGWHHTGTTRMSSDPTTGVVDRNCRVFGMSNLFVAGSSVFPTAGSGTPTFTLVALALRLADHLRSELA